MSMVVVVFSLLYRSYPKREAVQSIGPLHIDNS
jgi:hypothetical protein